MTHDISMPPQVVSGFPKNAYYFVALQFAEAVKVTLITSVGLVTFHQLYKFVLCLLVAVFGTLRFTSEGQKRTANT